MKSSTSLDAFVEKVKSDPALRRKIEDAEKLAASNFESLKKIAKDAGHDVALDTARPNQVSSKPTDQEVENLRCVLTCCWVATSVWDTEGPSIGGF